MKTSFAAAAWLLLACLVACAVTTAEVAAQGAEGRDYGGSLNIGPNFKHGGQYSPPTYGPGAASKAPKVRIPVQRQREVVKSRKSLQPKETDTDTATTSPPKEVDKEETAKTSTPTVTDDAHTSAAADDAASSTQTCKRFEPTTGQTITVPCQ